MNFKSLRSNTTRGSVLRKLSPPGGRGMVQRWLHGNLVALAEIYIPHRLYEVTIHDRGARAVRYVAVDAAVGTLDPYEFGVRPGPADLIDVESRNFHPVLVDDQRTRQVAIDAVQRSLFLRGFFRIKHPRMTARLINEIYVPYWAGFFGREQDLEVAVLNGVRQTLEGNKLRRLVQAWLLEDPPDVAGSAALV